MAWGRDRQFPKVVESQRQQTAELIAYDQEVVAMGRIVTEMHGLSEESIARVMRYLNDRYRAPYKFDEGASHDS